MSTNSTAGHLTSRDDKITWEIKVKNGEFDGLVGRARFVTPPEFLYAYRCEDECNGHMAYLKEDEMMVGLARLRRVALSREDRIALYEPDEQQVDLDSARERELLGAAS